MTNMSPIVSPFSEKHVGDMEIEEHAYVLVRTQLIHTRVSSIILYRIRPRFRKITTNY
jgi:hypothetical protein